MRVTKYEDFYRGLADYYDQVSARKDTYNKEVDNILSLLGKTERTVLELGVGTGETAIRLARRGVRVVGIDISRPMLGIARQKCARLPIKLVYANAKRYSLDETFAGIISCGGPIIAVREGQGIRFYSYFLSEEDLKQALSNAASVLDPGTSVLIAVQDESPERDEFSIGNGLRYRYLKHPVGSGFIEKTHAVFDREGVLAQETYRLATYSCSAFAARLLGTSLVLEEESVGTTNRFISLRKKAEKLATLHSEWNGQSITGIANHFRPVKLV